MVATVGDGSGDERDGEPHDRRCNVRPGEQRPGDRRHHVAEDVLNRVSVDRRYSDRRRPLVVHLVDVPVEEWMVEKSTDAVGRR